MYPEPVEMDTLGDPLLTLRVRLKLLSAANAVAAVRVRAAAVETRILMVIGVPFSTLVAAIPMLSPVKVILSMVSLIANLLTLAVPSIAAG